MSGKFEDSELQKQDLTPTSDQVLFPDGGWSAWATVLGSWLIQFSSFGYTIAFGIYEDYYVRDYLTNYTSSNISWIGSLQTMLLFTLGFFSGRSFDRGYFGAMLSAFSLFMLSLSHQQSYYQIFLSQGLGQGIAFGLLYIPSLSIVGHHFMRRRALAMAIATTGASVGGIIHPIMLNHLFHGSAGFHVGVRASAGLNLCLTCIGILLAQPRLPPKRDDSKLLPQLWTFSKDLRYVCAISGAFLALFGTLFVFFYLQLDVVSKDINSNLAFSTIAIMNGASTVGRLSAGYLAAFGVFNLIVGSLTASSVLVFCMLAIKNTAGFISFCVLFGLSSGTYISLIGPMLAVLSRNVNEIGARVGFCFSVTGVAALVSSPISGALLSKSFIWWRPIMFAGVCYIASVVLYLTARYLVWKERNESSSEKTSQMI